MVPVDVPNVFFRAAVVAVKTMVPVEAPKWVTTPPLMIPFVVAPKTTVPELAPNVFLNAAVVAVNVTRPVLTANVLRRFAVVAVNVIRPVETPMAFRVAFVVPVKTRVPLDAPSAFRRAAEVAVKTMVPVEAAERPFERGGGAGENDGCGARAEMRDRAGGSGRRHDRLRLRVLRNRVLRYRPACVTQYRALAVDRYAMSLTPAPGGISAHCCKLYSSAAACVNVVAEQDVLDGTAVCNCEAASVPIAVCNRFALANVHPDTELNASAVCSLSAS